MQAQFTLTTSKLALPFIALALSACGGGGSTAASTAAAAAPTATASTALYFTDDFSANYDAVWLTVSRVTVVSPTAETELAAFSPGKLINLPTLRNAGALVASAVIPATATSVRVYVGAQARLQQLDGSLLDVGLTTPGGYLEFKLEGWNTSSGVLALDFDLPRFSLQGTTLTAATRVAGTADYAGWRQRSAELEGAVAQVSADSLLVATSSLGQRSVVIDANTTYVSSTGPTWRPAVGDQVEVSTTVTGQGSANLVLTARVVRDKSQLSTAGLTEVQAMITAVVGTQVTATVIHSDSPAVVGTISFDVAAASYTRGGATALVPGVRVEAYLSQAAGILTAKVVEVDGAAKSGGKGEESNRKHAEVKGIITSVAGSTVLVRTVRTEGMAGFAIGGNLSFDLAAARFDEGALSCLAAGLPIEVKGSANTAGVLTPVEVSVGGSCSASYPSDDGAGSGHHDLPVTSGMIDTEGSVTAVRAGEFDISVFDLDNAAMTSTVLTVRYAGNTVFRGLTAATIAVGGFVDVKGDLNAGVITARKIEPH